MKMLVATGLTHRARGAGTKEGVQQQSDPDDEAGLDHGADHAAGAYLFRCGRPTAVPAA